MPAALVLRLRALKDAHLPRFHGALAYTCALDLFMRLNPALASALHDARGPKAFTTSPLREALSAREPTFTVASGEVYSWRLTGLSPEVEDLLQGVTPHIGGVRLGNATFQVEEVIPNPAQDPDAGALSYADLVRRWQDADPPFLFTFRFLTPTTFRVGRQELPFPLPALLFRHLQDRWEALSPVPLPTGPTKPEFHERVVLANWKGETRRVVLANRHTVGFIGRFTFREQTGDPHLRRLLATLTDFAFFSGVGWQTAHGLGQTRPEQPFPLCQTGEGGA